MDTCNICFKSINTNEDIYSECSDCNKTICNQCNEHIREGQICSDCIRLRFVHVCIENSKLKKKISKFSSVYEGLKQYKKKASEHMADLIAIHFYHSDESD
jgi:hypothetical protein